MEQLRALTIASFKMYFRNKSAVFFSLFIPILIIIIFGVLLGGNGSKLSIGINDQANNQSSQNIISQLKKIDSFTISSGVYDNEIKSLKSGDRDIVLVFPKGFSLTPVDTSSPSKIQAYYDQAKSQTAQVGLLVLDNIVQTINQGIYSNISKQSVPQYVSLEQKGIETNNLSGIDFLVPGIIAMSIMQLGLFSVAFAFTTMKKTGALKRLQATPAKPSNFIIAQSLSRLGISMIQVLILIGIGIALFKLHMYGNIIFFFFFILLGAAVFLAMGFAVAGYSKDENQAAPITNFIQLPMLFLSGVFFPRTLMPDFLKNVTSILPLTYLADALRQIANNGAGISQLWGDFIGLLIWAIICMIIAVKVFKWE